LAPEFFTAWSSDHPALTGVDIRVKRGSADNELTRYRYDVVIHKAPTAARSLASTPTWPWDGITGMSGLGSELTSQRPVAVRVADIPRAGLVTDVEIELALAAGAELDDALTQAADSPEAHSPEDLHRLGESLGYRVRCHLGYPTGHPWMPSLSELTIRHR